MGAYMQDLQASKLLRLVPQAVLHFNNWLYIFNFRGTHTELQHICGWLLKQSLVLENFQLIDTNNITVWSTLNYVKLYQLPSIWVSNMNTVPYAHFTLKVCAQFQPYISQITIWQHGPSFIWQSLQSLLQY